MLTKKSLLAISTIFKHSCFFKILPFDWNPTTFTFTAITDSRILLTLGISICVWLNTLYLLVSYQYYKKSLSPSKRALHLLWLISGSLASIFTYSNLRKRHEIVSFFNQYFKFQKVLEGKP